MIDRVMPLYPLVDLDLDLDLNYDVGEDYIIDFVVALEVEVVVLRLEVVEV